MVTDRTNPRSSVRTAVVWDVVRSALETIKREAAQTQSGSAQSAQTQSPFLSGTVPLDIVDVGGGTGGFAVALARLGHRVTVIDPSPDALAALERRAAEAGVSDAVRAAHLALRQEDVAAKVSHRLTLYCAGRASLDRFAVCG